WRRRRRGRRQRSRAPTTSPAKPPPIEIPTELGQVRLARRGDGIHHAIGEQSEQRTNDRHTSTVRCGAGVSCTIFAAPAPRRGRYLPVRAISGPTERAHPWGQQRNQGGI